MKHIQIIILISALTFCSEGRCEDMQSYTNKIYNYTISYPSDLIIVDADTIEDIIISDKISRTIKEMFSAMKKAGWNKGTVVFMKDDHFGITIEERFSQTRISYHEYIESMSARGKEFKYEVSEQGIKIGNIEAIQFVTTIPSSGEKLHYLYNTLIPWRNYYFSVSCEIADNVEGATNINIYNNILESFFFRE